MKIFNLFKKLLYPDKIKCIVCNEEIFTDNAFCICPSCFEKLKFLNTNICEVCGDKLFGEEKLCERCVKNENSSIKLARAVFEYDATMKNLIHKLKYDNQKYLAKPLSNILYNYYIHNEQINNVDIIIPVPLHKQRLKTRGYNQTELLLQSFSETNKVKTNIVARVKNTPTQTALSKEERLENLQNAFVVLDNDIIKNKKILIVDDIFTTGATCNNLANLLLKNKAKSVKCLTLCHTVKGNKE